MTYYQQQQHYRKKGNVRTSLNELYLGKHQLETCLRMMMEPWDIRNEEIHGKDKATK